MPTVSEIRPLLCFQDGPAFHCNNIGPREIIRKRPSIMGLMGTSLITFAGRGGPILFKALEKSLNIGIFNK